MHELLLARPILLHKLTRPSWLTDLLAWEELCHNRLDVEHWRSVDCIEFGDEQASAFDSDDAADGASDSIRTVLAALGEDTDGRPSNVVPWMPSASNDLGRLDLMEEEQNFDVGELGQPLQGLRHEPLGKLDAGFLSTPEVVFCVRASRLNKPDCFDLHIHRDDSSRDAQRLN